MLRQCAGATYMYAADHADTLPYIAVRGGPFEPIRVRDWSPRGVNQYFDAHAAYVMSVLWPAYLDAPRQRLEYPIPRSRPLEPRPEYVIASRFELTKTAFASRAYFDEPAVTTPDVFRPMRLSECQFPASKGLFLDRAEGVYSYRRVRDASIYNSALFDGSAREARVALVEDGLLVPTPLIGTTEMVHSTRHGIAGRDFAN
jgi:hypothetical protein